MNCPASRQVFSMFNRLGIGKFSPIVRQNIREQFIEKGFSKNLIQPIEYIDYRLGGITSRRKASIRLDSTK